MPRIPTATIGVALDMFGCPNGCRHCWLGRASNQRMTEDDLRWVVEQFRAFSRPGEDHAPWQKLRVLTWFREPDFSGDYRRLYELENELSDLPSQRAEWELLSIWRAARDPEYPRWAYSIGVRVCQISFFGLETATDWGYRRRGAFRDALIATERLLEAGIRPRWQWFFTKRIMPDLPGLIALTQEMHLKERCETLGGPFTLFLHCPAPDGEAFHIEHLRPTTRDLEQVPAWLREQSEQHIKQPLGEPEGRLVPKSRDEDKPLASTIRDMTPGDVWFDVTPDFNVYPSFFETTPPFCLGNLKTDGVAGILDAFETDRAPGLQAAFHVAVSELARRLGRPRGRRIYTPSDLKNRWATMWAECALNAV